MPTTEAQKRASAKWKQNNAERFAEIRKQWIDNNRDKINEQTRIRQKMYYDAKKSCDPDAEFKNFRRILLNLY
jgi:hypothetical protein